MPRDEVSPVLTVRDTSSDKSVGWLQQSPRIEWHLPSFRFECACCLWTRQVVSLLMSAAIKLLNLETRLVLSVSAIIVIALVRWWLGGSMLKVWLMAMVQMRLMFCVMTGSWAVCIIRRGARTLRIIIYWLEGKHQWFIPADRYSQFRFFSTGALTRSAKAHLGLLNRLFSVHERRSRLDCDQDDDSNLRKMVWAGY